MPLAFIRSKTGVSLIVALVLIAGSLALKTIKDSATENAVAREVGLIADSSVRGAIVRGEIDWERSLKLLESPETGAVSSVDGAYATSAPLQTTASDRFARELFTLYVQAKQSGQSIDAETAEKIAELVLSNDYTGQMQALTVNDILTTTDTSPLRAKAYGNVIGSILTKPREVSESELVILDRAINGQAREKDQEDLGRIAEYYRKMADSLKKTVAPQDAAPFHLDLINGALYLAFAVDGMMTFESDPVGSLTKIRSFEDGVDLISAGDLGLRSYFSTKKVSFSSDEKGYIFVR